MAIRIDSDVVGVVVLVALAIVSGWVTLALMKSCSDESTTPVQMSEAA